MKFKELRQRLDELTVKLGDPVIDPKEAEALMQKQRAVSPDAFFLKRLAGVETRLPDFGTDEATEKAKEMTPGQIAGQRIYAGIRAYDRLHGTVLKQPRGSFSGNSQD